MFGTLFAHLGINHASLACVIVNRYVSPHIAEHGHAVQKQRHHSANIGHPLSFKYVVHVLLLVTELLVICEKIVARKDLVVHRLGGFLDKLQVKP